MGDDFEGEPQRGKEPLTLQPAPVSTLLAIEQELCDVSKRPAHWARLRGRSDRSAKLAQWIVSESRRIADRHARTAAEKKALEVANLYAHLVRENLVDPENLGVKNFTNAINRPEHKLGDCERVCEKCMEWMLNGHAGKTEKAEQSHEQRRIADRIRRYFFHGQWLSPTQDPGEDHLRPNYFWEPLEHASTAARYVELGALLVHAARRSRTYNAKDARIVNLTGCEPFRAHPRATGPAIDDDDQEPDILRDIWDAIRECVAAGMRVDFVVPKQATLQLKLAMSEIEARIQPIAAEFGREKCRVTPIDVTDTRRRVHARPDRPDRKDQRQPWEYFSRQWRYLAVRSPLKVGNHLDFVNIRPSLAGFALNYGMHTNELESRLFWEWVDLFVP